MRGEGERWGEGERCGEEGGVSKENDIVTVLGTVCIQTYSCPEVSYAIKYMCR